MANDIGSSMLDLYWPSGQLCCAAIVPPLWPATKLDDGAAKLRRPTHLACKPRVTKASLHE